MDKTSVTFNIPSDLSAQAKMAGLLNDEAITIWLRKELDRLERVDGFFDDIDRLAALEPPITPEEIAAEIEAYHSDLK